MVVCLPNRGRGFESWLFMLTSGIFFNCAQLNYQSFEPCFFLRLLDLDALPFFSEFCLLAAPKTQKPSSSSSLFAHTSQAAGGRPLTSHHRGRSRFPCFVRYFAQSSPSALSRSTLFGLRLFVFFFVLRSQAPPRRHCLAFASSPNPLLISRWPLPL